MEERVMYRVTTSCDQSGAIYDGRSFCLATTEDLAEAQRIARESVIDGVRGPGCLTITDDDGEEYDFQGEEKTTTETLRALAQEAEGLRYDSPEAKAILDREDWPGHWPVIDGDGCLTGDVVTGDDGDWANVRDRAAIMLSTAEAAGWTVDEGYATKD